jgi:hypothetical protein
VYAAAPDGNEYYLDRDEAGDYIMAVAGGDSWTPVPTDWWGWVKSLVE